MDINKQREILQVKNVATKIKHLMDRQNSGVGTEERRKTKELEHGPD